MKIVCAADDEGADRLLLLLHDSHTRSVQKCKPSHRQECSNMGLNSVNLDTLSSGFVWKFSMREKNSTEFVYMFFSAYSGNRKQMFFFLYRFNFSTLCCVFPSSLHISHVYSFTLRVDSSVILFFSVIVLGFVPSFRSLSHFHSILIFIMFGLPIAMHSSRHERNLFFSGKRIQK